LGEPEVVYVFPSTGNTACVGVINYVEDSTPTQHVKHIHNTLDTYHSK